MNGKKRSSFSQFRNLFKSRPEKEKSFKDILKDLVESSSLHGVPKIVSSRQIAVKVLWCLLFIATFSVLVYQLTGLFKTFYSHPIQTTVSLEFSSVKYPAVSICNMNPVRNTKLSMSDALKQIMEQEKDNEHHSTSTTSYTPSVPAAPPTTTSSTPTSTTSSTPTSTTSSAPTSTTSSAPTSTTSSTPTSTTSSAPPTTTSSTPTSTTSSTPTSTTSSAPTLTTSSESNSTTSSESTSTTSSESTSTTSSESTSTTSSAPVSTTSSESNSMTSSESPSTTPSESYSTYSTTPYFSRLSTTDWYTPWWYDSFNSGYYEDSWTEDVDYDALVQQQLHSPKDEWDERALQFRTEFKNETLEKRQLMGHQKEDLIMAATFAGVIENVTKFQNFTSSEYGNCYTMTSPRFIAWGSGPSRGIKLTLNVENDEYVQNFSTGFGVRLVLHEPGTYPLPSDEGITVGPGTETSIGLKVLRLSRLGKPYGNCVSGQDFSKQYRWKYSTAVCYHFCRVIKTMEVCACIPVDAPDAVHLNKTVLPVCNSSIVDEKRCLLDIDKGFNNGEHSCDCPGPCKEILYESTMSSRYWPMDHYVDVLLLEICAKNKSAMPPNLKLTCDNLESLTYEDHEKYRNNFLRVIIYFEDLNYETISEEPVYESVRFLSDIGGAMGLFLGASVLSLVEVLQLLMEIVLFIRKKVKANKTTKVQALK